MGAGVKPKGALCGGNETSLKLPEVEVDENFEIFSLVIDDDVVDDMIGISGGIQIPKNRTDFTVSEQQAHSEEQEEPTEQSFLIEMSINFWAIFDVLFI